MHTQALLGYQHHQFLPIVAVASGHNPEYQTAFIRLLVSDLKLRPKTYMKSARCFSERGTDILARKEVSEK